MIYKKSLIFLLFFCIFFPKFVYAEARKISIFPSDINMIINDARTPFLYSGLASFYNSINAYMIEDEDLTKLDDLRFYSLTPNKTLAIVTQHNILLVNSIQSKFMFETGKIRWIDNFNSQKLQVQLLPKSDLFTIAKPFQKLKYAHLWSPFRSICDMIELILLFLHSTHNFGWGVTIIILSLLFKIFMLPSNILLIRSQRRVSYIQAKLNPALEKIKVDFSGQEAHEKAMAAYKAEGVSPFYTLKPLMFVLIPLPFLIAIFNVLGELDLLVGQSFLWIRDLAYPDKIFDFAINIPLLGSSLNLLPFLMTSLTVLAALFYKDKIISKKELNRQKFNLCCMAVGLFILFYPFPSAMVLYWTSANVWQIFQQRYLHV